MVKLTFENTAVKLGKPVDPRTLTSLVLKSAQIDDLGTFEKFVALTEVDLSSNRICFQRQLNGLFAAKATVTHVNLTGNPVCTSANYRLFVIFNLPELQVLDGSEVTAKERQLAEKVIGLGEVIEVVMQRDGVEEEEEEIARLAEEASRTKIDPAKRKEDARREQERLFEEERAEAERIAALLGAPTGTTPIEEESSSSSVAAEKEAALKAAKAAAKEKAEKEKEAKAAKEEKTRLEKEAKAAAKAEKDAQEKAKKDAEKEKKAAAEQAKKEAEQAKKDALEEERKKKLAEKSSASTAPAAAAAAPAATAPAPTSAVAPTPTVTGHEDPKESHGAAVFTDARSGLVVSTALSDRIQALPEPVIEVKPVPQRKLATEESIFGTQAVHDELDFSRLPGATSAVSSTSTKKGGLWDDDDDDLLFTKATKAVEKRTAAKAAAAAKPVALKPSQDDDGLFEMLGSGPVRDSSKPKKEVDDLFALLTPSASSTKASAAAKPKSGVDSSNFDIDSFISSTKSSGGGLFDE